jgi:hypothetical protein
MNWRCKRSRRFSHPAFDAAVRRRDTLEVQAMRKPKPPNSNKMANTTPDTTPLWIWRPNMAKKFHLCK